MRAPLALAGLALLAAGLPAPDARRDRGRVPGQAGHDRGHARTATVTGPPGDDVILVLGRGTSVFGGAGDDTICLREGDGAAFGGSGHDSVEARGSDAADEPVRPAGRGPRHRPGAGRGHPPAAQHHRRERVRRPGRRSGPARRLPAAGDRSRPASWSTGCSMAAGRYRLRGVESVYAGARHTTLVGAERGREAGRRRDGGHDRDARGRWRRPTDRRRGRGRQGLRVPALRPQAGRARWRRRPQGPRPRRHVGRRARPRRGVRRRRPRPLRGRDRGSATVNARSPECCSPGPVAAVDRRSCLPQPPTRPARASPPTIVQPEGIVQGTDGDDVIVGGAETKVRAGEGDDTICVTGGRVEGGDGDDSAEMRGTDGADFVELRERGGRGRRHGRWARPRAPGVRRPLRRVGRQRRRGRTAWTSSPWS